MKWSKIFALTPLSITLLYLLTALCWILLSDHIIEWFASDIQQLSYFQTMKGVFFVVSTSGLLFFLIDYHQNKITAGKSVIDDALKAANMAAWKVNIEEGVSSSGSSDIRLLGVEDYPEDWSLREFWETIHPDDFEEVREQYYNSIRNRTPFEVEYRVVLKDDSIRWMRSRGTLQQNSKGEYAYMTGVIADITEEKRLSHEYEKEKELFERVFESIPVIVDIYEPETNKIRVNEAFEDILGWSNEELPHIDLMKECYPDPEIRKKAQQVMQKAEGKWYEFEVYTKNKEKRIQRWINFKLSNEITLGLGLDITEQKLAEERVISSFVEGENRERKRIAQELHDGLAQYLTAANMNLDTVSSSIEKLSEDQQNRFTKGINFLKHAITEIRSISHNLMPRAVEDYGLPMALEALIDNYRKSTDINFYYYHNIEDLELKDEVAINVYRIAQEALSNAIKYAEAEKINVQLIKDNLDLILTIDDNGIGYDSSLADFKPGLGLQTIKTRTDAISGFLEVDSSPGKGTLLHVIVPIGKYKKD